MIKAAEEDNDVEVLNVTLGRPISTISENKDPFNLPFEDVRKLKTLNKAYVRKADRQARNNSLTGYKGQKDARSKQIETQEFYGYTYLDCVVPPYNIDYLSQLYEISPAHHAAVNAKVEAVYGLGYQWVESQTIKLRKNAIRSESGRKAMDKVVTEATIFAEQWISNANNIDTIEEILRKLGVDYESTGNAYLEIGRDVSGFINYIGHIPSIYMRVRRMRDGFVQIFSNKAVFFRNLGDTKTENPLTDDPNPNEVIHFKKPTPTNVYYGVPDIISAKGALAGNEFSTRYNLDFFENKAVPRTAIILKGKSALSTTAKEKLVEFLETGLRGQHHRSILIPLGGETGADIEFKSIEADQQDFSFGEYRKSNDEQIFMAHRIPMSRVGVLGDGGGNLAAAREADKVFKESYANPEQSIFEKKFNKVISQITDAVVFQLNELSLTDEETQSKIDESRVRMQIDVPDEVRARIDRKSVV